MSPTAFVVFRMSILLLSPQNFGVEKCEPQTECGTAALFIGRPIACLDGCEQKTPPQLVTCNRGVDEGRTIEAADKRQEAGRANRLPPSQLVGAMIVETVRWKQALELAVDAVRETESGDIGPGRAQPC